MDLDIATNASSGPAAAPPHRQTLLIRQGRGRTGGSTGLDFAIQRARHQGRRVKPLDGDLRSRTLRGLYPPTDKDGRPVQDAASWPSSENPRDMQSWLSAELDRMVETNVSAVLDLGGGERVVGDFVRDVDIPSFCQTHGIRLVAACFIGPDLEDFTHVQQIMEADVLKRPSTICFLNEGVIRQGQTADQIFDPLLTSPAFRAFMVAGVRTVFVRRLSCLSMLRERGLSFNDVIEYRPDRNGVRASPTQHFMVDRWLKQSEQEHIEAGTVDWLP